MQGENGSQGIKFPGKPDELLRFQVNLLALAEKHYDVLHDDQWIKSLLQYQSQLYQAGYSEFSHSLLQILGEACVCSSATCREKVLFIFTVFVGDVIQDADDELLQAVSWNCLRWLSLEEELLSCSESVYTMLPVVADKLLDRGRLAQFSAWLQVLRKICDGHIERPPAVMALAARLEKLLLGRFLDRLNEFDKVSDRQSQSDMACLLNCLAESGGAVLIEELYSTPDKDRRLSLVELLVQLGEEVAPKLIGHLGEDATWYMVRNAVHIISQFDSTKHMPLVLPFLRYPDLRIQRQVIAFICGLEEQVRIEQLVIALATCHDRLKSYVIELLSEYRDPRIESALVELIQCHEKIEQWSRNHLLQALCKAAAAYRTVNVVRALENLITEREAEKHLGDPVVVSARKSIQHLTHTD